jgi:hypothetical protein
MNVPSQANFHIKYPSTQPDCPICNTSLLEIHAGLYCDNSKCMGYKQKVVACCEGGAC